jgi:hypothetical protein
LVVFFFLPYGVFAQPFNKGGSAIISGMRTEKSATDPIAGRLFINMINDLLEN